MSYLTPYKLLPHPVIRQTTRGFFGPDSEAKFKENLVTAPDEWLYRTKAVTYTVNSQSYRCPEFDTIDWKNSVVIQGCSNVFGVGLTDSDTISAKLENILGRPVINLGVGGTGPIYAMQNTVLLNHNFPTPWAVINIWSDPDRIHDFTHSGHIRACTATSDHTVGSLERAWGTSKTNPETHSLFAMRITDALWSSKTRYLALSHWRRNVELDDNIILILSAAPDLARDLAHPGIGTAELAANLIATGLAKG